ncbi:MAG: tetratricopeptide repeat protein [Zoogloeaceae bacterium]|jgi:predicted O-linked N-acetylglucosamine transferase (SPINDLY family)/thioredoxin-like negative regulator of GroEL|nr:tetratricopeptide repeat protein [Zoogloeaceae bacterium]
MSEKARRRIDKGKKALAQKDFAAAGALFEEAVTLDKEAHAGWFGLGEVALAIGQPDTAAQFLEEAARLKPDMPRYLQRLGEVYGRDNRPEEGVRLIEAARRKAPRDTGVLASLSGAYVAAGDWPKAYEVLQELVRHSHPKAAHFCLLGLAAQGVGKMDAAVAAFRRATRMDPNYPDAWNALGHLHLSKNRLPEAEECLEHLFALAPQQASIFQLAGELEVARANWGEAARFFHVALEKEPNSRSLQARLALVLTLSGDALGAVDAMTRANEMGIPEDWILEQLGYLFVKRYDLDTAQKNLEMSVERNPDNLSALNTLFVVYSKQGKSALARETAETILQKDPEHISTLINMGGLCSDQARDREAIDYYRRALELAPESETAYSNYLWTVIHSSEHGSDEILQVARAYDEHICRKHLRHDDFADRDRDPERRLKIGWLTSDMRQHPVAAFVIPFLRFLDRQKLETTIYHNTALEDDNTRLAKMSVGKWREVQAIGDDALANLIRADGIDILVDLNGNTEGHRLLAVARKPAPVQVTWLGFPGTSGMSSMDYIFVPPDPVLEKGGWCTETPWPLADCYGVRTNIPNPPIQPGLPCERPGRPFTFACLNNFRKVSQRAIRLWSEILTRAQETRLILVARGGQDETLRAYIESQFARYGITPERLDIRGIVPMRAYFESYNEVDLGLDPFPFNGGTTGYDSIWMGVPFVTWPGDALVSRMGRIILKNVGLDELIAETPEAYVDIAVALSKDRPRLRALRANLRERMQTSPLMDAPRMARSLEEAFRGMWRRWVSADKK